jgi:hypothetical protein
MERVLPAVRGDDVDMAILDVERFAVGLVRRLNAVELPLGKTLNKIRRWVRTP